MKPYQITIKGLSGSIVAYSGLFRNSMEALSDALNRLTEVSKIKVAPCQVLH